MDVSVELYNQLNDWVCILVRCLRLLDVGMMGDDEDDVRLCAGAGAACPTSNCFHANQNPAVNQ